MNSDAESLVTNTELEEPTDHAGLDITRLDFSRLRDPATLRALAILLLAILVLVWPQRTSQILARLIGIGLLLASASSMWRASRTDSGRLIAIATGALGIIVGIGLLITPNQSDSALGRVVGAALIVVAVRDLIQARRGQKGESTTWIVTRSFAYAGLGALLVSFPSETLAMTMTFGALGWIALSLMVIVASLDASTSGVASYAESTRLIGVWLEERPKSVDDRQALYNKILYEGPQTRHRVIRFYTLMGFASVIATMGVITDSTAVVIGAMLIAPLMTPLMGMAISLVMGWPRRLARSAMVAGGGILVAIGVGLLLTLITPNVVDTASNSQILGRSSPTTLDLVVAVAAGAAGAYGLSRPDVSDSLPGVAIAISLVPPLAVVGISYAKGDAASGNGALLLFLTNMLAILSVGGLTFIATGVTPLRQVAENQHRVRSSMAAVAALAAAVLGALLLNGAEATSQLLEQSTIERTVDEWLDDYPEHLLARIDNEEGTIVVTIVGPSNGAPSAQSVADDLHESLDRDISADVRLIVEERERANSGG